MPPSEPVKPKSRGRPPAGAAASLPAAPTEALQVSDSSPPDPSADDRTADQQEDEGPMIPKLRSLSKSRTRLPEMTDLDATLKQDDVEEVGLCAPSPESSELSPMQVEDACSTVAESGDDAAAAVAGSLAVVNSRSRTRSRSRLISVDDATASASVPVEENKVDSSSQQQQQLEDPTVIRVMNSFKSKARLDTGDSVEIGKKLAAGRPSSPKMARIRSRKTLTQSESTVGINSSTSKGLKSFPKSKTRLPQPAGSPASLTSREHSQTASCPANSIEQMDMSEEVLAELSANTTDPVATTTAAESALARPQKKCPKGKDKPAVPEQSITTAACHLVEPRREELCPDSTDSRLQNGEEVVSYPTQALLRNRSRSRGRLAAEGADVIAASVLEDKTDGTETSENGLESVHTAKLTRSRSQPRGFLIGDGGGDEEPATGLSAATEPLLTTAARSRSQSRCRLLPNLEVQCSTVVAATPQLNAGKSKTLLFKVTVRKLEKYRYR